MLRAFLNKASAMMTCREAAHCNRSTLRRRKKMGFWWFAALLPVLLAACGKAPQVHAPLASSIGSPVAYPISAAYDARTGSLIVGSYGDGSLARLPLAHVRADPSAAPLP